MKTTDMADLLDIPGLPKQLAAVADCMQQAVTTAAPAIREPIVSLLHKRGKRLRPALLIASAASRSGPINDDVIRAAAAIELAHLATLVHDDIMDQATTRWGLPTISASYGLNQAIVVGDYLLTLAISEATAVSQAVGRELAMAITTVCNGQSRETADDYNLDRTIKSYNQAIHDKTAALMAAACKIGALCAELPSGQVRALEKYGEAFGMAFQIIDDVLDFTSTSKALGKPVGNDAKNGIYTLPLLLALRTEEGAVIRRRLGQQPSEKLHQDGLLLSLRNSGAIDQSIARARVQASRAVSAVSRLPESPELYSLRQFPERYLDLALRKASN